MYILLPCRKEELWQIYTRRIVKERKIEIKEIKQIRMKKKKKRKGERLRRSRRSAVASGVLGSAMHVQ